VTRVTDRGPHAVTVATPDYVVAGYLGPLPEAYTDWLQNRVRDGDRVMADFFDLFNHRFNALRFEARARNRPMLANLGPDEVRRNESHRDELSYSEQVAALAGLAAPGLLEQLPSPRRAWLGIAGLLANRRRSAPVLTAVLSRYLGAKVLLRQLAGAWRAIVPADRTTLGRANSRLGTHTVLGSRLWEQHARIELEIGPLSYARFCELLPKGSFHESFAKILHLLTDRLADCRIRLRLEPAEAPEPKVGALRLGQTAWLGRPKSSGVYEAVFTVGAYA
jgi:type VI secretion system protein ImpH